MIGPRRAPAMFGIYKDWNRWRPTAVCDAVIATCCIPVPVAVGEGAQFRSGSRLRTEQVCERDPLREMRLIE